MWIFFPSIALNAYIVFQLWEFDSSDPLYAVLFNKDDRYKLLNLIHHIIIKKDNIINNFVFFDRLQIGYEYANDGKVGSSTVEQRN